ncbi:MAG: hypothetical protein M5U14_07560 [Acidimicrobiia bacterium]|nr:hypothetical protein [Acidimicrobiia bacterium]
MRDPGTARRNPLFVAAEPSSRRPRDRSEPDPAAGSGPGEVDPGEEPRATGRSGAGADAPPGRHDPSLGELAEAAGDLAAAAAACTACPVGVILATLRDAQPEATEHLLAAAHELVLAVKTVVGAADRVLEQQLAGGPARRAEAAEGPGGPGAGEPGPEPAPERPRRRGGRPPRVRHIDVS